MKTFPYVLNKSDEIPAIKIRQGIQQRDVVNTSLLFRVLKQKHIEEKQQ